MYCPYCGNFIGDNSAYCPHCGAQQGVQYQNTQYQYVQHRQYEQYEQVPRSDYYPRRTNTNAVFGFILSFFIAIAGLICSIFGYKYEAIYGVIGIIFSFIIAFIGLICSVVGYRNAPMYGGNGRGLAVAGFLFSILSMISAVILYFVLFTTILPSLF